MKAKQQFTAAAIALSLIATGCGADKKVDNDVTDSTVSDGYVLVSSDKDYTPLYAEPSAYSERIAQMEDKKPVTVYSLDNGWYYVSYNGQRGYVKEDCISFTLTGVIPSSDSEDEQDDSKETEAPATTTKKTTAPKKTTTTVTKATTESTTDETTAEDTTETEAKTEETETETTVTDPPETEAPADPGRPLSHYNVFVCESDIIHAAGIVYTDYMDFCTLTDLRCNNGDPSPVIEEIAGNGLSFNAMRGIRITDVLEGSMSVSGKLTLHRWEWANAEHTIRNVYDEKTVSFTFTMDVKG